MDSDAAGKPMRLPKKAAKVKNKAPAQLQITAEQLLREAKERELEIAPPPPKQKITDPEELAEYQRKRRKEFEDNIRKNRSQIANWVKYAKWEESVSEMQRARSVFERALDVDHRSITLWLQYAEMEMRNRQVNHARNVWDRAVTILPRATQFWLKYSYMEEMIENVPGARQVFERWMEWEPPEQAWQTYINFEVRYKEIDRARNVWQRFLHVHGHDPKNWLRYARFEERNGAPSNARAVYERGLDYFGEENMDERLLIAFAQFEERQKEHERARVVYRYALDNLPKERTVDVFKFYTIHEKKYGERAGIETVIVSKRRHQYEQQIAENSYNYDAWFDYLRLLQNESQERDEIEDCFERAIANIPPEPEKRLWRRYIYLWINYALYEELDAKDDEKTRDVYKACLDLIPHKKFTFAKIWLMFAHFELRQKNLTTARKILGAAIGKCPKDKLFRGYIDMELQLREFDRCRILYEKYLEFSPENCTTWIKFAELETLLGDVDRARAVYNIAIGQPALDMPEVLWKAFVDFEIGQEEYDNARNLYKRLLQRTKHVKVWISCAQFELGTDDERRVEKARDVYRKANKALQSSSDKEERLMLLESWKQFEVEYGSEETQAEVNKELPRRVKKRRQIQTEEGVDAGWEEYYDYIFPSDEASKGNFKLLEAAKKWKERQQKDEPAEKDDKDASEEGAGEEESAAKRVKVESTEDKQREGDSDSDIESTSSESGSESEGE
uniref:Crooked neck-like protein 1 n=2 Tax=Plectus sambesii TaxID=2011161 RepID=A0A914WDT6_9BILA